MIIFPQKPPVRQGVISVCGREAPPGRAIQTSNIVFLILYAPTMDMIRISGASLLYGTLATLAQTPTNGRFRINSMMFPIYMLAMTVHVKPACALGYSASPCLVFFPGQFKAVKKGLEERGSRICPLADRIFTRSPVRSPCGAAFRGCIHRALADCTSRSQGSPMVREVPIFLAFQVIRVRGRGSSTGRRS